MLNPKVKVWIVSGLAAATLGFGSVPGAWADRGSPVPTAEEKPSEPKKDDKKKDDKDKRSDKKDEKKEETKKEEKKDELDDYDDTVKESEKVEGLFTFHRKKDKLFMEIKPEQLDKDYLFTITQESGIGVNGIYNGMPLQDFLCRFKRVNDQLFFVQRNTNFRARPGQPVNRSLERAFADSILVSMKLESVHKERKSLLVDVSPLFLGELPALGQIFKQVLGTGYNYDGAKSYYGRVKSFPQNSELQTYYSFNTGDLKYIDTVPDARNLTIRVHYSLSALPEEPYRPRLADERLGYFLTAYQDFSTDESVVPFVRYINRWRLEKKDPDAALSEPKKPITFWLENTIPTEYRDAIRDGVLRWNVAFEKAGFKNAIEVKQQPDDADWDPADVRYSTIRWINTVDAAFAMGPSRVNPLTGEILDADIVVDANFIRYVKSDYRAENSQPTAFAQVFGLPESLKNLSPAVRSEATSGMSGMPVLTSEEAKTWGRKLSHLCMVGPAMMREMAFGATALQLRDGQTVNGEVPKAYLDEFWGNLIAHEVGHTLGLRHNFHASTLLSPDELYSRSIAETKGLCGSVMDYNPAVIAQDKSKQGYYFTPTVGPYDVWVIQYGYTPISASDSEGELPTLRQIASRNNEPELAYATDEDAYDMGGGTALDPLVITYDHSSDPIEYSRRRMELAQTLLAKLEDQGPGRGQGYEEFRRRFGWITGEYYQGYLLSRWIGGSHFSRNRAGDPGEKLPIRPVPAAQQRKALDVIRKYILAEDAFRFNPDTLNKLAASRWSHWGQSAFGGGTVDYPLLERVESVQWNALARIYDPLTMRRILNTELRVKNPKDALTLAEVFGSLTDTLWSETLTGPRNITPIRRNVQRDQLDAMVGMVVKPSSGVPNDARSLARGELKRIQSSVRKALAPTTKPIPMPLTKALKIGVNSAIKPAPALDAYSKAHLEDVDARISQALAASMISQ